MPKVERVAQVRAGTAAWRRMRSERSNKLLRSFGGDEGGEDKLEWCSPSWCPQNTTQIERIEAESEQLISGAAPGLEPGSSRQSERFKEAARSLAPTKAGRTPWSGCSATLCRRRNAAKNPSHRKFSGGVLRKGAVFRRMRVFRATTIFHRAWIFFANAIIHRLCSIYAKIA
jgi:hypothetical protein